MKIAIIQMPVAQGDFQKNIEKSEALAKLAKEKGAELAVFPEMFLCGFNYKKNLEFLKLNGNTLEAEICAIAKRNKIAICGTIPYLAEQDEIPSNRMIFADSNGKVCAYYDKIHLFSVFNENLYVKEGNSIVVAETPFGKCGFAICYDIRFPELFVELAKLDAKFVIISAAFPNPRSEHWRVLSRARAIENQFFVVAVNQCGEEKFGTTPIRYFGMSAIIDPWGGIVTECQPDEEDSIAIADINLDEVDRIREKIPVQADRRFSSFLK